MPTESLGIAMGDILLKRLRLPARRIRAWPESAIFGLLCTAHKKMIDGEYESDEKTIR
jgi:hypothetical protein